MSNAAIIGAIALPITVFILAKSAAGIATAVDRMPPNLQTTIGYCILFATLAGFGAAFGHIIGN